MYASYPGLPFEFLVQRLAEAGIIAFKDKSIILPESETLFSEQEALVWESVESYLSSCLPNVPAIVDIAEATGQAQAKVSGVVKTAARHRRVFMMAANRPVLASQALAFAGTALELATTNGLSVADFRKSCGIGRNLAVEVLEYFDKIGFTLRKDGGRVILDRDRVNKLIDK